MQQRLISVAPNMATCAATCAATSKHQLRSQKNPEYKSEHQARFGRLPIYSTPQQMYSLRHVLTIGLTQVGLCDGASWAECRRQSVSTDSLRTLDAIICRPLKQMSTHNSLVLVKTRFLYNSCTPKLMRSQNAGKIKHRAPLRGNTDTFQMIKVKMLHVWIGR